MAKRKPAADARLEQARALVAALEHGDQSQVEQLLDDIGQLRETALFQEVGRLTRQLHDTLANFAVDERLADLTEKEIPDAKERLNYVIAMTEQAANTTLNAVEAILPITAALEEQSGELAAQWQRFRQREMSVEEFRDLSRRLGDHLTETHSQLGGIQGQLTEVLMAQGFQDLTGQIIRRVIQLVQDVEQNMVDMIRISGRRYRASAEPAEVEAAPPQEPKLGPSVPGIDTDAVHSQDDVDALLSSLGF